MDIQTTFSIGDKCYQIYTKGVGDGLYRMSLVGTFHVDAMEVRADGVVYLDDMGYSRRADELCTDRDVACQHVAQANAKVAVACLQAWEDEDAEYAAGEGGG